MKNEPILFVCVVLLSAMGTYFILPRLIQLLKSRSALDLPNHRSSHKVPTPTMGGISFFIGLLVAIIVNPSIEIVLVALLIALSGALGFWDDLKDLSPKLRLVLQALIATGFYSIGFTIGPLVNLLIGVDIPAYLNWSLTVFFMLGLINAFNLIDGVDGLLIGLTLIASMVFSIIFFVQGQIPSLIISLAITGVSIAFLIYNFEPAKIFMGDTGSLFMGTYISSSVLKITESADARVSLVAISLIVLACVDMLRLFLGRYFIQKKPFKADRNHMHHILLKMGWTHRRIVLNIYLFQVLLTLVGFYLLDTGSFLLNLLMLVFLCVSMYGVLQFMMCRERYKSWKKTIETRNKITGQNHLLKSYLE